MAWYPGAEKMELQPESDTQAAIRPTQLIVHSIVANWTARRTYEFWRDSTNLESHFGIGYAVGDIAQYIGTETRADANAQANRRPDGTGAISVETASNSTATDPWNASQLKELIDLCVWAHKAHGIPLRICRTHDDPGFGFHSMFPEWSSSGTACPGPARIKQFREVVFPGIVARAAGVEEDDMDPVDVWAYRGTGETRDAYWYQRDTNALARQARDEVRTLAERVGTLETTGLTEAQMARLADLVADKLSARLAQ